MNYSELFATIMIEVSWIFIVVAFLFATGTFPGKWYRTKIPSVQLKSSIAAVIFSIIAFMIVATEININNLVIGVVLPWGLIAAITLLFASIYKRKNESPLVEIEMKKGEYEVKQKMVPSTGHHFRVDTWIETDTCVVCLQHPPTTNNNLTLWCRRLKSGEYVCENFYESARKVTLKDVYEKFLFWLMMCFIAITPVVIIMSYYPTDEHPIFLGYGYLGMLFAFVELVARLFRDFKILHIAIRIYEFVPFLLMVMMTIGSL